ncbi:MAG: HAMP domain-containing protein [Lachnospiraceae bacterium]|nr:HAMP domain-containing protein [Lachnospiraceae bacterium]MBQ8632400.1 HAMP domain-containing protein [Lachnospiraceae bacterium]
MKHFSLLWKLLILFAVVSVSLFVLLNTAGLNIMQDKTLTRTKEELYQDGTAYVSDYLLEYYEKNIDYNELVTQLELLGFMTDSRVWLVSKNGLIVLDSEKTASDFSLMEADASFLEATFRENVYYKGIMSEPMLCVTVPVISDYINKGHLVLSVPMSRVEAESVYYLDFANIAYLIFQPVLLAVFLLIYRMTAVPVKRMAEAAKKFSRGNFKEPLELKASEEYRELAHTIRYMGDKLKNADDAQRKFVSNVSHDFRSPLTSIKGYVEAIKDGTIPPEMQEKYLDIIIFETERLTKLTSNLLELNSFDDNGIILHKSEFDINQMIKQIALSFEGTFKKKKLVLNLVFSEKEQFVRADKDKIEQVLYNLIDNAGKFSNPETSIRISTEEKGNKVMIAVKDKGIGIPKESQSKIWDRFYKTDISRGKDKKGTGLGLSIVKEIITAHEENISVVSTEGVGTEFIFSLPQA